MAAKYRSFAERRKVIGYSKEKLAQELGVELSTVGRWERGETEPQPWNRPRLATATLHEAIDLLDNTRGGASLSVVFGAGRELYPWRGQQAVHDVQDRLLALVARG